MNTPNQFARRRRRAALALLAVCALAGLAGIAHAGGAGQAGTSASEATGLPFPPSTSEAAAAASFAAFGERFALLRSADPAGLPRESVTLDPGIDRAGAVAIQPASAQELADAGASVPDARLWVAPRDDGTECLLAQPSDAQGPAIACAEVEAASGGYLLMTQTRSESDVELYGLVPDGVERVSVVFADGSETQLPVRENAYAAHFGKPTAAIAFVDRAGERHELAAGVEA